MTTTIIEEDRSESIWFRTARTDDSAGTIRFEWQSSDDQGQTWEGISSSAEMTPAAKTRFLIDNTDHDILAHVTSGEKYVVVLSATNTTVVAAAGPLHYSAIAQARSGNFDNDPALVDEINADLTRYRVVAHDPEEGT